MATIKRKEEEKASNKPRAGMGQEVRLNLFYFFADCRRNKFIRVKFPGFFELCSKFDCQLGVKLMILKCYNLI